MKVSWITIFIFALMGKLFEASTQHEEIWRNVSTETLASGTVPDSASSEPIDSMRRKYGKEGQRLLVWGKNIFFYGAPTITIIGLCGNLASFLVMMSTRKRCMSSTVYLSFLALADTQALLYLALTQWYTKLVATSRFYMASDVLCKVEAIWKQFSMVLPAWVVVAVALERFLITFFPFHARRFCTAKTASIIMTILFALSMIYGTAIVSQFGIGDGPCHLSSYSAFFARGQSRWLLPVVYSFVPLCLLVIFGTATVWRLMRSGVQATEDTTSSAASKNARKATKVVLAVVAAYVALTLPPTVFHSIQKETPKPHPPYFAILFYVTYLGFVANHSLNFFLYVLVSKAFRRSFLGLIGVKAKPAKKSRNTGTTDPQENAKKGPFSSAVTAGSSITTQGENEI